MQPRSWLLSLVVLCLATSSAQAQKKQSLPDLPDLPPTPVPLPDLGALLEQPPDIKASRPGGKKIVGLAWSAYSAAPGELNELEQTLRTLLTQKAEVSQLPPALIPCDPDNTKCIAGLASGRDVDVILFGQISKVENGYTASIRAVDPQARIIAKTDQNLQSKDPAHVRAWAEAIACRLKLQTKCNADFKVSADLREFRLFLDNKELATPFQAGGAPKTYTTTVGVHDARVMFGQNTSLEHKVPVATAAGQPPMLYARRLDKGGLVLQPESDFPPDLDGKVHIKPSVAPKPVVIGPTKVASIALAGAGVILGGLAVYEVSHGKSLVNGANDNYGRVHVYTQADVSNINSGNSAVKTGNLLFGATAVLLAAGGVLFFAF